MPTNIIITPDPVELEIGVVSPEVRSLSQPGQALKAVSIADAEGVCEFLIKIHPEIYVEERLLQEYHPGDRTRYTLFLRAIDAVFCEFRNMFGSLHTWLDPYEAPYAVLPFLTPIVGIEFNFDLPEEQARREIANAIFLWKRKGTRDNILDWISFITGFRTKIREFYKEVIRTNVWGQAYFELDKDNIVERAGDNYATLPHLDEHHATNTWNGNSTIRPFYVPGVPDTNYGVHGYTQIAGGSTLPGYLFRNHIGLYVDVPDENLEFTWYGSPYYEIIVNKIERILDLIILYGVEAHLFWRIITEEDAGLCEQLEFTAVPRVVEGWDDVVVAPDIVDISFMVNCNAVEEEGLTCIGETGCLDIDDVFCGNGRLANVLICTNDPDRVTNADGNSPEGGPWFTWHNIRYWPEWVGDTLLTYVGGQPPPQYGGDGSGTLLSQVNTPPELTAGEKFISPYIGTGTGQGREFECGMSDWVIDTCLEGGFDDLIIEEDWTSPFTDIEILTDDWEATEAFVDTEIIADTWDYTETFNDTLIVDDNWDYIDTFIDTLVIHDDWEDATPLAIPGLTVWFTGGNVITSSPDVNTWIDRSNSGNDAEQTDPAVRPEFIPTDPQFNDFPVVRFDAANGEHLVVTNNPSLNTDEFTVFVVGKWTAPATDTAFVSKVVDETWAAGWALTGNKTTPNQLRFHVDDYVTNFVETALSNNTPAIMEGKYDQVNVSLAVNGANIGLTSYGAGVANSAGSLHVGAYNQPGLPPYNINGELSGDIAEIVYFNRALTPSESLDMFQYLSVKYGIGLSSVETLEHTEEWEYPVSLTPVEKHEELWEPAGGETLEHFETWEPPTLTPTLEHFEEWESEGVGPGGVVSGLKLWLRADDLGPV
jgi:phage tail-like protein